MAIRVLLADDHALFLEGMSNLLTRYPDIQMAGIAKHAGEAVRKTAVLRPDVVLMDLAMPLGGGIEATRQILAERPEQPVCMLTISDGDADLFAAIRAGARGYLLKTATVDEVVRGLRAVAAGGSVLTPRMAARLLKEFSHLSSFTRPESEQPSRLTSRERQVLLLVATGAHNKEIADQLDISQHTVKVHLHNILDKLSLRNRRQAAAFAVQAGMARARPRIEGYRA
jgi:two-component system NarL family response regulator